MGDVLSASQPSTFILLIFPLRIPNSALSPFSVSPRPRIPPSPCLTFPSLFLSVSPLFRHHSSPITRHPSLVTHYSLAKNTSIFSRPFAVLSSRPAYTCPHRRQGRERRGVFRLEALTAILHPSALIPVFPLFSASLRLCARMPLFFLVIHYHLSSLRLRARMLLPFLSLMQDTSLFSRPFATLT